LETLHTAERELNQLIDELQAVIRGHHEKGNALQILPRSDPPAEGELNGELNENDKGKEREILPADEEIPKTAAGEDYANKRRVLQQRLRDVRVVLHRIKFLQGDVYHVLGGQHALSETESYAVAEEIRRDLLKGWS
jgi:E3 ubiquitin-protein ligase SHPRH